MLKYRRSILNFKSPAWNNKSTNHTVKLLPNQQMRSSDSLKSVYRTKWLPCNQSIKANVIRKYMPNKSDFLFWKSTTV